MIFSIFNQKVFFLLAVFLAVFGFTTFLVEAQTTPEIWATWKASSYVPADFPGKAMPSEGTLVTTSFEVVDNGKFVNLAGYEIYWYLNDELIKTGLGEQQVSFRVPTRGNHQIRIQVNDYNGANLVKTIEIPAIRPEAVIVAPYARDSFSGSRIQVKAVPYFFNTAKPEKLNFSWKVNGQKPATTENISFLDISLGGETTDGYEININLSISNPNNLLLSGSTSKILTFQK